MDTSSNIFGRYTGQRGELFGLALKTALLTAVTLGIYRFWAKTRIRKYIWSSISGDGDSFEYTGTGLEKFLGFLVAIVVLAIYLGIIQMVLFYFGLNLFSEPRTMAEVFAQTAAFYITFFAAAPLIFFAQYRARRYKLARTRWRGVRFGAEIGAWGYVLRAIGHWMLTILTLGLLLPRQTFYLEKYVTDRSWYGTARFEQQGRWTALYPAMKHLLTGVAILIGSGVMAAMTRSSGIGIAGGLVGYIWVMVGLVSYRVQSFKYLTNNKVLDGGVSFHAEPETGTIVGHVLIGGVVVGLVMGVLFAIIGGLVAGFTSPIIAQSTAGVFLMLLPIALLYIFAFSVAGALSMVWITQPIIDHVIATMTLENADALDHIRQRAADAGADAEGFADALDVGGAI